MSRNGESIYKKWYGTPIRRICQTFAKELCIKGKTRWHAHFAFEFEILNCFKTRIHNSIFSNSKARALSWGKNSLRPLYRQKSSETLLSQIEKSIVKFYRVKTEIENSEN